MTQDEYHAWCAQIDLCTRTEELFALLKRLSTDPQFGELFKDRISERIVEVFNEGVEHELYYTRTYGGISSTPAVVVVEPVDVQFDSGARVHLPKVR